MGDACLAWPGFHPGWPLWVGGWYSSTPRFIHPAAAISCSLRAWMGLWEPGVGSHLNLSLACAGGAVDRVGQPPHILFFVIQTMGAHLSRAGIAGGSVLLGPQSSSPPSPQVVTWFVSSVSSFRHSHMRPQRLLWAFAQGWPLCVLSHISFFCASHTLDLVTKSGLALSHLFCGLDTPGPSCFHTRKLSPGV